MKVLATPFNNNNNNNNMAKKKITARGFGARYGKKARAKYGEVEALQRKKQKCPFCNSTAKRIGKGIWKCKKCKKKFASGTFHIE